MIEANLVKHKVEEEHVKIKEKAEESERKIKAMQGTLETYVRTRPE
jgi:hypothetical protein